MISESITVVWRYFKVETLDHTHEIETVEILKICQSQTSLMKQTRSLTSCTTVLEINAKIQRKTAKVNNLRRLERVLTTHVRVRTIQDKNFMRLVTEINLGLACDRDV